MRTKLLLLAAACFIAACAGWGIDLAGTKCNDDGSCGGDLVCVDGTCRSKTALSSDAASAEDASVPADAQVALDAGRGPDASSADAESGDAATADAGANDAAAADASPVADASLADAGGSDASTADASAADASAADASAADASGADVSTSLGGSCADGGWCVAALPARAGGWDLTAVAGRGAFDLWVGGRGPALLHWDGAAWKDYSDAVAKEGKASGYPVKDINFLVVDDRELVYGGAAPSGSLDPNDAQKTLAAACGFKSFSSATYPDAPFVNQGDCGDSKYTVPWVIGHGRGLGLLMVGADSKRFLDVSGGAKSSRQADWKLNGVDYYGALAPGGSSPNYEVWGAGPGGALCFQVEGSCAGSLASSVGGPTVSSDLHAVLSFPSVVGSLFFGGQGALYECDRGGGFGAPSLSNCQNDLSGANGSATTILGLSGTGRDDVWAWGKNGAAAVVLRRTGVNAWSAEPLPVSGSVRALARLPGLVVVVADNGAVVSKAVP
jgi:hypothetical protein